MGGIPWTPKLSKIRLGIEVWKFVLSRLRSDLVGARTILRKKRKAGMECVNANVNKEFAKVQINVLFKTYREYLTQKVKKRQEFQDQLAISRAKEGKNKVSVEIERMQQTERQRVSSQRIRIMNGLAQSSKGLIKMVVQ